MIDLVTLVALGAAIGLVLGGLGGGGGVLTVPALVFVVGQSAAQATASSLVVVGAAAVVGAMGHARAGRVAWGTALGLGAAGLPTAWLGSRLSHSVDERTLLLAFAALMVLAAGAMLRGCPSCVEVPVDELATRAAPRRVGAASAPAGSGQVAVLARPVQARGARTGLVPGALVGLAVGLLTGFLGVGGGFVVVPALVVVLRLPMAPAVGTSLVVVALNSASALVARSAGLHVDWAVVAPFAGAAVAGVLLGRRVADRVHGDHLRRGFAALLVLVAAATAVSALG